MKTFYSAEDIEALAAQGITELRLDADAVLTHLARDTAQRLGIALVSGPSTPRAASSAVTSGPPARPAAPMAAKPKGCQHGPLTGRTPARGGSAGSSDKTVNELIDLVKQLADRGKD